MVWVNLRSLYLYYSQGLSSHNMSSAWSAGGMTGWRCDRDRIPWMKGYAKKGVSGLSVLDEELDAFDLYTKPVITDVNKIKKRLLSIIPKQQEQSEVCEHWTNEVTVPQNIFTLYVLNDCHNDIINSLHNSNEFQKIGQTGSRVLVKCIATGTPLYVSTLSSRPALSVPKKLSSSSRRLSKMLIHTLWQSSLLSESGLSPEAIFCMVVCLEDSSETDGRLLLRFLKFFGQEIDFRRQIVTPNGIKCTSSCIPTPETLVVLNSQGDCITSGCIHFLRVQQLFSHCASALERWNGPSTPAPYDTRASKSPLASITAFNKLATAYFQPPPIPEDIFQDDDAPPPLLDE